MARTIVEAFECDSYLYALSDDGILFVEDDGGWKRLPSLPEGE